MLAQHHTPVCLSLSAYDLPLWSIVETNATLYQREPHRFHLLLTEPLIQDPGFVQDARTMLKSDLKADLKADFSADSPQNAARVPFSPLPTPRLLWFEITPNRVIMTMQGNGQFSYRHFWEHGVYGLSRYWLQTTDISEKNQIRLRNFTRSLYLKGRTLPRHLRIEYELWANQLQIGHYVMNIDIQHEGLG